MIPRLETERLILREFRNEDFENHAAMMADEETVRYLGGVVQQRGDAWRGLCTLIGHWVLRGYGRWAVEEKVSGQYVGHVGLWNPEGWPGLEVGWTIGRQHWGKGYAPEAGKVALSYGFLTQKPDTIISVIDVGNLRSQAVATRLGERKLRQEILFGAPCDIWGIARKDWQRLNDL